MKLFRFLLPRSMYLTLWNMNSQKHFSSCTLSLMQSFNLWLMHWMQQLVPYYKVSSRTPSASYLFLSAAEICWDTLQNLWSWIVGTLPFSEAFLTHLLEERNIITYTDHKPLSFALCSKPETYSPGTIFQFTNDIQHISRTQNAAADALS